MAKSEPEVHPVPKRRAPRRLTGLGDPADRVIAAEIQTRIGQARRSVILGHEHPDGDCVGSAVALCSMLRLARHDAVVLFPDPVPPRYTWLETSEYVRQISPHQKLGADLAIILDTTDLERLGGIPRSQLKGAVLLNIDHHVSNQNFGATNWVDANAAATGELIWRLAEACEWIAPPVAQEALYAALVTDTGQFAYSNTNARVLRMAADLVEGGVDPESMWKHLYLDKTPGELELEARARDSFEVWANGAVATIALNHDDFVATRTSPQASQEFAAIPRSLAGCELALFFYEIDGGRATKISIRSRKEINANELAQRFGGGGHRQAAGCRLLLPLAEAKRRFRPIAEEAVERAAKEAKK